MSLDYIVYRRGDGAVLRGGYCQDHMLDAQAHEPDTEAMFVPDTVNPNNARVVDGVLIETQQLADGSTRERRLVRGQWFIDA
jgi:hypothetical protein